MGRLLQGSHLSCLSADWAPWLTYSNCDSTGKNCQVAGMLHEIVEVLAEVMNFTFHCDNEVDSNWGLLTQIDESRVSLQKFMGSK